MEATPYRVLHPLASKPQRGHPESDADFLLLSGL